MINWPTPPTGTSAEASFFRRLVDCCKRSTPKHGPGFLVDERPDGLFVRFDNVSNPNGSGGVFQDFIVVSDLGDAYSCYKLNSGGVIGTNLTRVAKHQDMRCIAFPVGGGWATKMIRGVTYTYTYNPVVVNGVTVEYTRTVVGDDNSGELDYITPALAVGDIITAFAVNTNYGGIATLQGVKWQALADGRAWSKK